MHITHNLTPLGKSLWWGGSILVLLWLGSLFFGFHYGNGWSGVSLGQGELQFAYAPQVQSYSSSSPPQGWSFFRVPFDAHWLPDIYDAFGIYYLIFPLWIPATALAIAGLVVARASR
ncbi:MAG: hypothetical protein V7739_07060 [Motiliproteus sp.]